MAFACTAMELQDRRLSICKASASKISKPSPVLRNLSATSSPSSSPPTSQLPSSITSSPSRPIAKVVNADPSSFRRVVQELTGTTVPSTSSSPSNSQPTPRSLSRLQRIAPPPLRSGMRTLKDPPHHQSILQQMQHQQASQTSVQRNISKVGSLSPTLSVNQFGNRLANPTSDLTAQSGNPNLSCVPSLPMLSPHLLSPLPALTPGDNTWANPIDVISHSPKPVQGTSSVPPPPPLLQLPNVSTGSCNNWHGNALLAKPVYARYGEAVPTKMAASASALQMVRAVLPSHVGALPPLLSTAPLPWPTPHVSSSVNELPPWSPSPFPFSPGLFPPSPSGLGPPLQLPSLPPMSAMPHVNNANLYSNSKYGTMNLPNMPSNFSF